jgi:dTDP-4-dehydrorhamnose reductase
VNILILGASGFLGSYCEYYFQNSGNQVVAVARKNHNGITIEDFESYINKGSYDLIVNAVAVASHEECEKNPAQAHQVNALFPESWARAALITGAKFVHISTDAVFDGESSSSYVENDEINPTSHYGVSKLEGEKRVMGANPNSLIIRTNFFGWSKGGDKGILDFFVKSFTSGDPIIGFDDYIVSSIYMGDLLDSIAFLIDGDHSGTYHVTSSSPLSKYEFGELVGQTMNLSTTSMRRSSIHEAHGFVERGRNLSLSNSKIEILTGVSQPSSVEGIVRAVAERDSILRYFGRSD